MHISLHELGFPSRMKRGFAADLRSFAFICGYSQIRPALTLTLLVCAAAPALTAQAQRVPLSSGAPAVLPAKPAAAAPSAVSPTLSIAPEDGLTATGKGSARFDAGEVDPTQTPLLERAVTLKNETAHPILIGQTRGSCGCTTILMTKDGREVRQASLLPGEQARLRIAIRTAGQHAGQMSKFVWAYMPGNTAPVATVEVAFGIKASVVFTPSLLNFGKVSSGLAASSLLTASVEASLVPNGALPPLVSSNSDVTVTAEGTPQTVQRNGKAWIESKYRVTVRSQARSGMLSGAVRFAVGSAPPVPYGQEQATVLPVSAAGASGVKRSAAFSAASPFAAISVPLAGEVSGGVTLMPKTVYLGSLPLGKEARRQVVVSGGGAKGLQQLTLSTNSPYLTASLMTTNGAASVQVIEITLNSQAPAGVIQAQVTITTAAGEKLLLPVNAVITAH